LNGYPGSTTTDCWSPSVTFLLPKLRKITIGNSPVKPLLRLDLNQLASMKPGAIHNLSPNAFERESTAKKSVKLSEIT
jgi:hypothetical protein